jgi:hypothetical protein
MEFPPIKAWSFSRLLNFEQCPYRTYLQDVVKSPRPPTDEKSPLVRGQEMHEEIENYLQNKGALTARTSKPRTLEHIDYCKAMFEDGKASVEEDWGFDNQWGTVGWFDENVWLRVKCDVVLHLDDEAGQITDWKSGKSMGKEVRNMQQGQLYAAGMFMRNPELQLIDAVFVFLDEDKIIPLKTFKREKLSYYIQRFEERANVLTTCTDFRPKPNRMNCRWCDFGPYKTKACAHGVQ